MYVLESLVRGLFRHYHLNRSTICNQTWYGVASSCARECHAKTLICYRQGHIKITSWLFLLFDLSCLSFCWGVCLMVVVHHHKCVLWKGWIAQFKVTVTAKVKTFWWMFIPTMCSESWNLFATRLGTMMLHHEAECRAKTDWFAVFMVTVTMSGSKSQ